MLFFSKEKRKLPFQNKKSVQKEKGSFSSAKQKGRVHSKRKRVLFIREKLFKQKPFFLKELSFSCKGKTTKLSEGKGSKEKERLSLKRDKD